MRILLEVFSQFERAFLQAESGMFLITVASELAIPAEGHHIRIWAGRVQMNIFWRFGNLNFTYYSGPRQLEYILRVVTLSRVLKGSEVHLNDTF